MPMSRSFLDADVEDLLKKLSTDEKISLLGAPNWWNTTPIERLEIPSIRMSDGPNVRPYLSPLTSRPLIQSFPHCLIDLSIRQ